MRMAEPDETEWQAAITVTGAVAVWLTGPVRRDSCARAENPVVRFIRTMLWPCGPGRLASRNGARTRPRPSTAA